MITQKELDRINELKAKKRQIDIILGGFDSPHVERTIGLVEANAASKSETRPCGEADWLHNRMPHVEKLLKETARKAFEEELWKIEKELAQYITKE